jgi:DNA-binding IclR family transcriptional regulator
MLCLVNDELGATEMRFEMSNAARLKVDDDATEVTVKSLGRAVRLLRCVAAHADGAMLSAVARETGLGKGTVHRLLNALIEAGLLFQDPTTKRYRLGTGLAVLGLAAHRQDYAGLSKPILMRLAELTEDTIYASVREGYAAACVAREIGTFPVRDLSLDIGDLRPLGVGSGSLALLAFLPDDEISDIIRRNAAWLERFPGHSLKTLLADVGDTRRRGFSLVEGRMIPGMSGIGVPVFTTEGRPVAALSLAAMTDRISGSRVAQIARMLAGEAVKLGKAMDVPVSLKGRVPSSRSSGRSRVEQGKMRG